MKTKRRTSFVAVWGIITVVVGIVAIMAGWVAGSFLDIFLVPAVAFVDILIAIWLATKKPWITIVCIMLLVLTIAFKAIQGMNLLLLMIIAIWEILLIVICRKQSKKVG